MTGGARTDGSAGAGRPVTEGTIRESPQHDEPSWRAPADLGTAPALGIRAVHLFRRESAARCLARGAVAGSSSQFGLDSLVPEAHGQDLQSSSRLASPHPYEVPNRMSNNEINHLARELVRVRRNLAAEAPYSPAWTATVELCDDLESQVRSLGMDPDALARSTLPARSRHARAQSSLTWTDVFAASAE